MARLVICSEQPMRIAIQRLEDGRGIERGRQARRTPTRCRCPSTRSENMSEVSVRLSPLASVRIERRARTCVAGLTSSA